MEAKPIRRRGTILLASAALIVGLIPGRAHALVAAAVPGSFAAGYATPVVATVPGGPLTFFNGDTTSHTLTASDAFLPRRIARKTKRCSRYSSRRCPLFTSGTVGSGESKDVSGLKRVKAGKQYRFICEIHRGMRGTLVVGPGGVSS